MKRIHITFSITILIFLLGYFLLQNNRNFQRVLGTEQQVRSVQPIVMQTSSQQSLCHINNLLPDSHCTPGAIDPHVTQNNIHQTICVSGYTKTVRPSVMYTNNLKEQQIIAYGYADTNPRDYEEDHLISLEIGGSPTDPKNLWPEPGASPNPKDKIENLCHEKVCNDLISLSQAQQEIAVNWQTACQ